MSGKYQFSAAERFGVWEVYGGQCFWCGMPIEFPQTTVDHIIPETYADKPQELARIKVLYGLGDSFEINGFTNWVPAHGICNSEKGKQLFTPSPAMVAFLHEVAKRAPKAKAVSEKVIADGKKAKILARLETAIGAGIVSKSDIEELFSGIEPLPSEGAAGLPILRHITPQWRVLRAEGNRLVVTDGTRVGMTSAEEEADFSWLCGNCHHYGPWNGVICLTCGVRSQPD